MGVCGAAQICRGDNNPNNKSNMQARPKSLSAARPAIFEHDSRPFKHTKTDSDSSTINELHPPLNTRKSHSHHNSSDSDTPKNMTKIPAPSLNTKSRESHQMGSTPPPIPTQIDSNHTNSNSLGISVRNSRKYIPLPDKPPSPNVELESNNQIAFKRERNSSNVARDRASSAEIIKQAEHALLEESTIQPKNVIDESNTPMVTPWLMTPVATPSTVKKPTQSSPYRHTKLKDRDSDSINIINSPVYPLDFADDNKNKSNSHERKNNNGPMGNFGGINSIPSTSSTTATITITRDTNRNMNNRRKGDMNGDDININNIYGQYTREPNLSMSAMAPSLLLPGPNNQFPRLSSTSSDFAHLVENERRERGSSGGNVNGNIFDEHIDINWRFSHGGSMTGTGPNNLNVGGVNTAGSTTFNSLSSIPIDRVNNVEIENGSINQNTTDL